MKKKHKKFIKNEKNIKNFIKKMKKNTNFYKKNEKKMKKNEKNELLRIISFFGFQISLPLLKNIFLHFNI
jgi:hypothetical protein